MTDVVLRAVVVNTLLVTLLVCGGAIAVIAEPQLQQGDSRDVDTFDPSTGKINRHE